MSAFRLCGTEIARDIEQTIVRESRGSLSQADVTVIGGGLAGMAASLHLAKAGFTVVCI